MRILGTATSVRERQSSGPKATGPTGRRYFPCGARNSQMDGRPNSLFGSGISKLKVESPGEAGRTVSWHEEIGVAVNWRAFGCVRPTFPAKWHNCDGAGQ